MTSVMSFEQISSPAFFNSRLESDDTLICPKAPTIKPMRFPNKESSLYLGRNTERIQASAVSEK